jgi:hypothetical protein
VGFRVLSNIVVPSIGSPDVDGLVSTRLRYVIERFGGAGQIRHQKMILLELQMMRRMLTAQLGAWTRVKTEPRRSSICFRVNLI